MIRINNKQYDYDQYRILLKIKFKQNKIDGKDFS
jgi:hypothetical protein